MPMSLFCLNTQLLVVGASQCASVLHAQLRAQTSSGWQGLQTRSLPFHTSSYMLQRCLSASPSSVLRKHPTKNVPALSLRAFRVLFVLLIKHAFHKASLLHRETGAAGLQGPLSPAAPSSQITSLSSTNHCKDDALCILKTCSYFLVCLATRLMSVEEELKKDHAEMQAAVDSKQKIIDAQVSP